MNRSTTLTDFVACDTLCVFDIVNKNEVLTICITNIKTSWSLHLGSILNIVCKVSSINMSEFQKV